MDANIKILIVEDEMLIGAKISMLLTEFGYDITALLPRAEEALVHVTENQPDIALLDVQLRGEMDGISLAEILHKEHGIPVIFLTANADDDTFHKAMLTRPYAFLTKPFKKIDLHRAIELTISRLAEDHASSLTTETIKQEENNSYILADRIFIRHKERMVKILFDAILFVEAERNYCRIQTRHQEYLLTMPMKNLESRLPVTHFQRIHRSHIVNLNHVDEVAEGYVYVNGKALSLSPTMKVEFLRRFNIL